jgi:hypothetical protein
VAELVDALDSKSSSARSAGSIPARGTKKATGRHILFDSPEDAAFNGRWKPGDVEELK